MSIYSGKKVLLASMHQKELAIQEPFEFILGCNLVVAENFNTDQFGTFSGEVERVLSAFDTLKQKAITAADTFGFDYVISSEGAFGPHPSCPLANSDIEMLLFYDRENQLFIAESEITTETNMGELELAKNTSYEDFLKQVAFPSHGLILKANDKVLRKGIIDRRELDQLISESFKVYPKLKLETDMRAMHNPTRMKIINKLAYKLAQRVKATCKACDTPGFGEVLLTGYLLCELCGLPTKVKKIREYKCIKCDHVEKELINPSQTFADPKFCDFCNP